MRFSTIAVFLVAVPGFAADPALARAGKGGPWSGAATGDGSKVPAAGAKVLVRPGHHVVYDLKSDAVIRSVHVGGTLGFDPDKDTQLNVGLIMVQSPEDPSHHGFASLLHPTIPTRPRPQPPFPPGT